MFLKTGNVHRGSFKTQAIVLTAAIASLSNIPYAAAAPDIGQFYNELTSGQNVSVVLLNHLKHRDLYSRHVVNGNEEFNDYHSQYEWGQAVGLFYNSGKASLFDDSIKMSVALGYNYMFKLGSSYPADLHNWNAGEKIFISEDCEWSGKEPGTGQYKCSDSGEYGKLAVANLRFDWGKGSQRGYMRVGDGFYNAGLITAASEESALLSTYRGIMAQQSYDGYILDGAFVTGFMAGNEKEIGDLSGGSNYYDPNPLTYDYLYTMRVRKSFDNSGYRVAYGEAKDYLRRYHTDVWYRHDLSSVSNLYAKAQYYYNRKAGDLWDEDVEKGMAAFDTYASAISYEFRYRYSALELMYGFSHIDAPREGANGAFSYGFGNAKGYLNLPTNGNYHGFRRDGTDAMVVQARYDFRHFNIPDFFIEYGYHWGKSPVVNKYNGGTDYGKEYEHAITMRYRPRTGMLQGFVFDLKQAFYRPDDTIAGILADDEFNKRADRDSTKLVVSYRFNL